MPVSEYYKGHGSTVMANMKKEYGEEKGKQVFYAKANKDKKMKPASRSEVVRRALMRKAK